MLDKVLTTLEIPVNGQTRVPSVYAVRGDLKTRAVFCKLTNGEPSDCDSAEEIRDYIISNGSTAVLKAVKPDGTKIFNTAVIRNGGVYVELTSQLLASEGTVKCEIYVYGTEDVITAGRFNVEVANQLFGDEGIESADEYSELQRIISTSDSKAAEASESASKAALSAANALLSSESAEAAEKNARSAEQGAKTAEQSTKAALTGYAKKEDIFDDKGNIAGGKLKNCAKVVFEFPNDAQSPADFTGQLCLNQPAHEVYICEAVGTDGTGYFLRLATAPELEKYLKKTDYADYDTPGAVKLATDTIYEAGEQPRAISEGYLSGSLRDYLKTEDLGKKIYQKYFYINKNGKLDAVAPDFDSTTGSYAGGLVRADDMTNVLRVTLISDMFGEGMKDADKTIACNNIGAARPGEVEVAIEEYLGKNNYIKWQEVPGALTAGKYIDISADGKITAKALNNYGTPSDMTDFSDNVLLTPQNMPEMTAITLVSNLFKTFMTDARKSAALSNLGAAKESVIDDALALDDDGYVTAIKGHALYPSIEGVAL